MVFLGFFLFTLCAWSFGHVESQVLTSVWSTLRFFSPLDVYFRVQCFFPADTRQLSDGGDLLDASAVVFSVFTGEYTISTLCYVLANIRKTLKFFFTWHCLVILSVIDICFSERHAPPPPVPDPSRLFGPHTGMLCSAPAPLHTSFLITELVI